MGIHRTIPLLAVGLIALGSSGARAEARWSGAAHGGLVFTTLGMSSGGWVGLHRTAVPHGSLGAEAGYVKLHGYSYAYVARAFSRPTGDDLTLRSASVVIRGRSEGPVRLHLLGGFGYYEVATHTHFVASPDQVEHAGFPGFGLAIGFSGTGLVRPGFQLRWDEVIRPHHDYLDVVSFAVGLHFN